MRRAVILHGTDGSPDELPWQAWLRNELEANAYSVYFPQLPNCHTPNLEIYDEFLHSSNWDFSDNLVIGHSSGATTILHLLSQGWFPKVQAAVLVGTFLNERLLDGVTWYTPGQFDHLFVEDVNPLLIKNKAGAFYFVHGSDDPYCDYGDAKQLCNQLGGTFLTLAGGGHIARSSGVRDLAILTERLKADRLL